MKFIVVNSMRNGVYFTNQKLFSFNFLILSLSKVSTKVFRFCQFHKMDSVVAGRLLHTMKLSIWSNLQVPKYFSVEMFLGLSKTVF